MIKREVKFIIKVNILLFTNGRFLICTCLATVGGFIGAVGTFIMGRKRKISPFLMIPFVGGGFLIGSQVGMVSGILSGMRTIKKLPDQARLVNLVKDIQ